MTKRTEALSAEFHQFLKDNKFLYDRMDEEQFVCYALSAIQKLDAANTPPDPLFENLDPNDPSDQQFLFHVEGLDTKDD